MYSGMQKFGQISYLVDFCEKWEEVNQTDIQMINYSNVNAHFIYKYIENKSTIIGACAKVWAPCSVSTY